MKWVVRINDESFRIKECFDDLDKAMAYADDMAEVFGSWCIEIYEA